MVLSPFRGASRRFPFFAPLRTCDGGSFASRGWHLGRCQMTIKASGIAAFVFVAGLWICATGPSQAADDADSAATPVVKQSSHLKTDAHRKSNPQAERSPSGRKTAAAADSDSPAFQSSQLPPSVANAN